MMIVLWIIRQILIVLWILIVIFLIPIWYLIERVDDMMVKIKRKDK